MILDAPAPRGKSVVTLRTRARQLGLRWARPGSPAHHLQRAMPIPIRRMLASVVLAMLATAAVAQEPRCPRAARALEVGGQARRAHRRHVGAGAERPSPSGAPGTTGPRAGSRWRRRWARLSLDLCRVRRAQLFWSITAFRRTRSTRSSYALHQQRPDRRGSGCRHRCRTGVGACYTGDPSSDRDLRHRAQLDHPTSSRNSEPTPARSPQPGDDDGNGLR
jgi:hypothetical protein